MQQSCGENILQIWNSKNYIGSEFTNTSFIQLLDKHKIEVIYATNYAPFVESFNRTMKRTMDRYK